MAMKGGKGFMMKSLSTPTFFTFEERVRHSKAGLLTHGSSYYLRLPGPYQPVACRRIRPVYSGGSVPDSPLARTTGFPIKPLCGVP